MSTRESQVTYHCLRLLALVTVIAIVGLKADIALGQAQSPSEHGQESTWSAPRLPDGRPDLQGFWTTQTFTPLQRPEHLANQEFYSEEEWVSLQTQLTAEGVDPLAGSVINIEDAAAREERLYQTNRDASYVHYDNEIWLRTPVPKGLSSRRTSLITDPPNGRIPQQTAGSARRAAARREGRQQRGAFDGYETRPLSERCIVWPHSGPPMLPPAYNDIHQILQTPDYVVLFTELNNSLPRIIPLDARPPLTDKIQLIPGNSRGRWEGDTLVVESRNFTDKTRFQGSTDALRVVERFTRIADETIRYEFTVEDPSTWAQPWSVEIPMLKTEGPMYEYACHEGNYDVGHILEINRNLERQQAAENTK